MCTPVHAMISTYNQSFEQSLIFQTPDPDYDLLFETLLKKLSSEIIVFYFFHRQFLRLCFKYTFEQILVEILCLEYQKLFKTLPRSRIQAMYWRAHKTATLTSIQPIVTYPR